MPVLVLLLCLCIPFFVLAGPSPNSLSTSSFCYKLFALFNNRFFLFGFSSFSMKLSIIRMLQNMNNRNPAHANHLQRYTRRHVQHTQVEQVWNIEYSYFEQTLRFNSSSSFFFSASNLNRFFYKSLI